MSKHIYSTKAYQRLVVQFDEKGVNWVKNLPSVVTRVNINILASFTFEVVGRKNII